MRKFDNNSWKHIANSSNFDEDFDEVYEEHLNRERRQKLKDKDRYALKEDNRF